jgi:hypothetical protein
MKQLLTLCFWIISVIVFAQTNDLRETRQAIRKKIENRQWDEIASIHVNNHPNLFTLSMRETEWYHLIRQDYGSFFAAIDFHENSMSLIDKSREVYLGSEPKAYRLTEPTPTDELKETFIQYFNAEWQVLLVDIERARLSDDLIQFLRYYIHFTRYQLDICSNEKQRMSLDEAYIMSEEFFDSKYARFAQKYSSNFTAPSNWGYGITIGLGYSRLQGTIESTLRSHFYFLSALDVSYKRFIVRTELGYGYARVRTPYFYSVHHEIGRQIGITNITPMLGYTILLGNRIVITPMFGMDFSVIRGVKVPDVDPESLVFRAAVSTGISYGISVEYNFRQPQCPSYDEFGNPLARMRHSSPFIRFSAGFRDYPLQNTVSALNGSTMFFSLSAGAFGQTYTNKQMKY